MIFFKNYFIKLFCLKNILIVKKKGVQKNFREITGRKLSPFVGSWNIN